MHDNPEWDEELLRDPVFNRTHVLLSYHCTANDVARDKKPKIKSQIAKELNDCVCVLLMC